MASDDECGEGECHHGIALYWNEFEEWGDCVECYRRVARFRAWQAFRGFLNGTPEQWQKRVRNAVGIGASMGSALR